LLPSIKKNMRWMWNAAYIEGRNVFKILAGKPEGEGG
jgi:hypothetical protein